MKFLHNIIPLLFVILTILLNSCQDSPPNVYIEQNYVESYLIVDQPIRFVKVMRTAPTTDSFKYDDTFIRDAQVKIRVDGRVIQLICDAAGSNGYYNPDTTELVQPGKKYDLEITLKDGTVMTGSTKTPARFKWINTPPDSVYYPKDTLNLTDGTKEKISWEKNPDLKFYYIIRIKCLDTLEYGKYLSPSKDEKNRRIFSSFGGGRNSPDYLETTRWAMVPSQETPIVWTTFKWFGKNEVTVMVADPNFMKWSLQYFRSNQYNSLLGNIKNGIGSFGSASQITKTVFLYKNQP